MSFAIPAILMICENLDCLQENGLKHWRKSQYCHFTLLHWPQKLCSHLFCARCSLLSQAMDLKLTEGTELAGEGGDTSCLLLPAAVGEGRLLLTVGSRCS